MAECNCHAPEGNLKACPLHGPQRSQFPCPDCNRPTRPAGRTNMKVEGVICDNCGTWHNPEVIPVAK